MITDSYESIILHTSTQVVFKCGSKHIF